MSAAPLLSLLSSACWVVALFPQLWHNYRAQSAHGLSPYLLLLWLLGDACNLIGCVLTEQLPFQTYLSCYFVLNDVALDFQYVYYTWYSPSRAARRRGSIELPPLAETPPSTIEFTTDADADTTPFPLYTDTLDSSPPQTSAGGSTAVQFLPPLSKTQVITTTTALLAVSPASAQALFPYNNAIASNKESIGLLFAWLCTVIYCSSRLPQLYHNYTRKSVDGVSPLLFLFAVFANTTYALSILCATVPDDLTYWEFINNELPYLLGSLGTVAFDILYFWQRQIYNLES